MKLKKLSKDAITKNMSLPKFTELSRESLTAVRGGQGVYLDAVYL